MNRVDGWALVRKSREAERDLAYVMYGDEWRKHVKWGGFFDPPTPEEKKMIEDLLSGE